MTFTWPHRQDHSAELVDPGQGATAGDLLMFVKFAANAGGYAGNILGAARVRVERLVTTRGPEYRTTVRLLGRLATHADLVRVTYAA